MHQTSATLEYTQSSREHDTQWVNAADIRGLFDDH
jgi:hypothetical protein